MLNRLTIAALLLAGGTAARADSCAPAPPPVRDLALERYYKDADGSQVDPAKEAALRAATAPLTAYVSGLTALADRAHQQRSSPKGTIACALSWLQGWAQAGAYLGTVEGKQAHAQRRWDLAGIALAYLKLRREAGAETRAAVEPWLIKVADAAAAGFDDPGVKRNNHWYWMGLGLAAVGLAADSERHWAAARGIMADAARDVAADGSLPLELARGARALHYHSFALMPLVTMAELAAWRREDWYGLSDGALARLVALTAKGFDDPGIFDKLAGTPQERPVKPPAGWPALYEPRAKGRLPDAAHRAAPSHRWLGGDVLVLRKVAEQALE